MDSKFYLIFVITFFTPIILFSQNTNGSLVPPKPIGGDSIFFKTIDYPLVPKTVNKETEFYAILSIDSLGNITDVSFDTIYRYGIGKNDSMFVPYIRKKLKSIAWEPAKYNGRNINTKIKIPFIFILTLTDNLIRGHHEPLKSDIDKVVFEYKPILINKKIYPPME
jgi:hypothetical protein